MNLENYARLLIRVGLNVKENQIVVIKAPVEAYEFVQLLSKEAFSCKARDVLVRFRDEQISHQKYLYASEETFESVPSYEADFYNQTSEQGACYLTLLGEDPDLMQDVNLKRMMAYSKAFRKETKAYRNRLDFMECQWCIAAVSTKSWAKKVYPDLDEKEAKEKLWKDILSICCVNEDPVSTWKKRQVDFETKVKKLNDLNLKALHYTNSLGTDCTIELPKDYCFAGGGSLLKDGTLYFANLPTEEVFSAPFKYGVNGKLCASYPLNYNGALIEDFWFEFKKGRIINYGCQKGKEILDQIFDLDENARYLGEVALVPFESPISQLNRVFYETLIDENASCHFALGQSYAECIKGGLEMNEEQLLEKGMNQSIVHIDFMVGTEDLNIEGITEKNERILIFENGSYSSLFLL